MIKPIYVSYHHNDSIIALRLGRILKSAGFPIWLDRLDCSPEKPLANVSHYVLNNALATLVLLSPRYLSEDYNLRELEICQDLGKPILPIIMRADLNTEIDALPTVRFEPFIGTALTDPNNPKFAKQLDALIAYLKKQLNSMNVMPSEERLYLNNLIFRLEARFQYLPIPKPKEGTRPRPKSIDRWYGTGRFVTYHQPDDPFQDIRDLVTHYPHIYLNGEPGSGKTVTLQSLALQMAHVRRENPRDVLLPIYVDLGRWRENDNIVSYIHSVVRDMSVSLASSTEARGTAIYLDDPANILADFDTQRHIAAWLQGDDAPAQAIIASAAPLAPDISHFVNVHLTPLNDSHIEQVIELHDAEPGSLRAEGIIDLARNPFCAAAFCAIDTTPTTFGELLADYARHLYEASGLDRASIHNLEQDLARFAYNLVAKDLQNFAVSIDESRQLGLEQSSLRAAVQSGMIHLEDDYLTFRHHNYVIYYAMHGLHVDGLPKRLSYPRLDDDGVVITTQWDDVIRLLAQVHPEPVLIVDTISDVNPLLALEVVQQGVEMSPPRLQELVRRLLFLAKDEAWLAVIAGELSNEDLDLHPFLLNEAREGIYRENAGHVLSYLAKDTVPAIMSAVDDPDFDPNTIPSAYIDVLDEHSVAAIMNLLTHPSWTMRRGAAWVLGRVADPASGAALVKTLQDTHPLVVVEALVALARIGEPDVAQNVIELLHHVDWRVRVTAADALAQIGKGVLPLVQDALQDDDDDVRLLCVRVLAQMSMPDRVDILIQASYDTDVEVRLAALESLGGIDDVIAVNRLIESLSDKAMLRSRSERIVDAVSQILREKGVDFELPDEDVLTASSVEASAKDTFFGGSETPLDTDIVDSEATQTRQGSSRRAKSAKIGKDRLKTVIMRERNNNTQEFRAYSDINSADADMRMELVASLPIDMPQAQAVPILKHALTDDEVQVRMASVNKLAEMSGDWVITGLLYALNDKEYVVSDTAAQLLQSMGERAIPTLLELLKYKNANVRGSAIEALGWIGDPIAVTPLIKLLGDKTNRWLSSETIGQVAAEALLKINTPAARDAVKRWTQQDFHKNAATKHVDQAHELDPVEIDQQLQTITALVAQLRVGSGDERMQAAKVLRDYAKRAENIDSELLQKQILPLLDHTNWLARWAAVESLAWYHHSVSYNPLIGCLHDENWMVRMAAIHALIEREAADAAKSIASLCDDPNENVREAAVEALGKLNNKDVLPDIEQALQDPAPFVRLAAVTALYEHNARHMHISLTKTAYDQDPYVRWMSVRVLTIWEDDLDAAVVDTLKDKLSDDYCPNWENDTIGSMAVKTLNKLGYQASMLE